LTRTAIVTVSLALPLLTFPLWLCSWTNDMLWDRNDDRGIAALWVRDGTVLWFRQPTPLYGKYFPWRHLASDARAPGPHLGRFHINVASTGTIVEFPTWFPAVLAGALSIPLLRWLKCRDAAFGLVRRGHCSGCTYDLRATPARCPECGRLATSAIPTITSTPSNQAP